MALLESSVVFLAAAVVAVPIAKKLGLGSVIGYLFAGIAIGPQGFAFISEVESILHFAEFGVVLLLFLIGLELDPKKLWSMRKNIFGLGGMQVLGVAIVFFFLGKLLFFSWQLSLIVGFGFALSSTALCLQILQERNMLKTHTGNGIFSILLFQDLAVIPMLSLLPFLGAAANTEGNAILGLGKSLLVVALVIGAGRFLLRPALQWIASLHLRELFTAFALLLVMGMALLMQKLELSMALGSFLAGVLLADSEYRHALETDIEPFKGLLLGLFFLSVGMSMPLKSLMDDPKEELALLGAMLSVKFALHFLLAKFFAIPKKQRFFFSLLLAQVGEFAFVLFASAQSLGVLREDEAGTLLSATALSMALTPLLLFLYDRFVEPSLQGKISQKDDIIEEQENTVIVAGFGRVGQIVARLLYSHGFSSVVLDHEPDQISMLRKFGFKVYYGDATRMDLLESAGAHKAKILVLAIDDVEESLRVVDAVKEKFPQLLIIARARNVQHYYELMDRGVKVIEREAFEGSLRLGVEALKALGIPAAEAVDSAQKFRFADERSLKNLHPLRKEDEFASKAKTAREQIEQMLEGDRKRLGRSYAAWDRD